MFNPSKLTVDDVMKLRNKNWKTFLQEASAYYSVNTQLLTQDNLEKIKCKLDRLHALKIKKRKSHAEIIELQFIDLIDIICSKLHFYGKKSSEKYISIESQKWMAKELTCQFLSTSLERNLSLRQTIPNFFSQLHPVKDCLDQITSEDYKYLYRNRDIYLENTQKQKEYNKQRFPDNTEKGLYDTNDGKFNILELYFFVC